MPTSERRSVALISSVPMIVEQEDMMARRMSDREGVGVETGFVDDAGVPFGNLGDGCRAFPPPRDVGGL